LLPKTQTFTTQEMLNSAFGKVYPSLNQGKGKGQVGDFSSGLGNSDLDLLGTGGLDDYKNSKKIGKQQRGADGKFES
jgi:hypothetical protein